MDSTVTANFEHPSAAEDAATALLAAGVPRDDVLVFPAESDEFLRAQRLASPNLVERGFVAPEVGAAMGFTLGFLGGGFLGLLLGTGSLRIMGVGPAMAVGPFLSAAIGAVVLGLAGALAGYIFNASLPQPEPAPLAPSATRSSDVTILRVGAPQEREGELLDLLNRFSPKQVDVWRNENGDWLPA